MASASASASGFGLGLGRGACPTRCRTAEHVARHEGGGDRHLQRPRFLLGRQLAPAPLPGHPLVITPLHGHPLAQPPAEPSAEYPPTAVLDRVRLPRGVASRGVRSTPPSCRCAWLAKDAAQAFAAERREVLACEGGGRLGGGAHLVRGMVRVRLGQGSGTPNPNPNPNPNPHPNPNPNQDARLGCYRWWRSAARRR